MTSTSSIGPQTRWTPRTIASDSTVRSAASIAGRSDTPSGSGAGPARFQIGEHQQVGGDIVQPDAMRRG